MAGIIGKRVSEQEAGSLYRGQVRSPFRKGSAVFDVLSALLGS